jgi:chromatin modification-related protein VID21
MWMRTDFREERKWKIVLAYDLSTAVLQWHKAKNREKRLELGLIVDWSKKPRYGASEADEPQIEQSDAEDTNVGQSIIVDADYASDASDDEQDNDRQEVVDALAPSAALDEAFEGLREQPDHAGGPSSPVEPKLEDIDDPLALNEADDTSTPMEVDSQQPSISGDASRKVSPHDSQTQSGLKLTSDDPNLAASSNDPPPQVLRSSKSKSNPYTVHRADIAYSDGLFYDFEAMFEALNSPNDLSNEQKLDTVPPPSGLSDIFPDLQPYNFFDLTPGTGSVAESRKKSEKRDRDDPLKRAELTTYTKLTPMSSFQTQRPTLLGPLRPSLHWKDNQWVNLDDNSMLVDFDAIPKAIDSSNLGANTPCFPFVQIFTTLDRAI